jgi:hypothetical protein
VRDQQPPVRRVEFRFNDGSWEKFDLVEPAALCPMLIAIHPRTKKETMMRVHRYNDDGSIQFQQCCPETALDKKIRVIEGGRNNG